MLRWIPNSSVALCCFFINILLDGLGRMSGILFVYVQEAFGTNRRDSSLPFVICIAVRNLSGPFLGLLANKYGPKSVTLFGGIVASIGIGLSYFSHTIVHLLIFWGIIFGIGYGMGNTLLPVHITSSYKKHLALASGISCCGSCIGSLVLPTPLKAMLDSYGFQGTCLILSAVVAHCIPFALLLIISARGTNSEFIRFTKKKALSRAQIDNISESDSKIPTVSSDARKSLEVEKLRWEEHLEQKYSFLSANSSGGSHCVSPDVCSNSSNPFTNFHGTQYTEKLETVIDLEDAENDFISMNVASPLKDNLQKSYSCDDSKDCYFNEFGSRLSKDQANTLTSTISDKCNTKEQDTCAKLMILNSDSSCSSVNKESDITIHIKEETQGIVNTYKDDQNISMQVREGDVECSDKKLNNLILKESADVESEGVGSSILESRIDMYLGESYLILEKIDKEYANNSTNESNTMIVEKLRKNVVKQDSSVMLSDNKFQKHEPIAKLDLNNSTTDHQDKVVLEKNKTEKNDIIDCIVTENIRDNNAEEIDSIQKLADTEHENSDEQEASTFIAHYINKDDDNKIEMTQNKYELKTTVGIQELEPSVPLRIVKNTDGNTEVTNNLNETDITVNEQTESLFISNCKDYKDIDADKHKSITIIGSINRCNTTNNKQKSTYTDDNEQKVKIIDETQTKRDCVLDEKEETSKSNGTPSAPATITQSNTSSVMRSDYQKTKLPTSKSMPVLGLRKSLPTINVNVVEYVVTVNDEDTRKIRKDYRRHANSVSYLADSPEISFDPPDFGNKLPKLKFSLSDSDLKRTHKFLANAFNIKNLHLPHTKPVQINDNLSHLRIFANPVFLCILLIISMYEFIFVTIMLIIVDYFRDTGGDENDDHWLLILFSIGEIIGRLFLGPITDKNLVAKNVFTSICFIVVSGTVFGFSLTNNNYAIFALISAYGIFESGTIIMFPLLIKQYMKEKDVIAAIPSSNLGPGFIAMVTPLIVGYFRDWTGSYIGLLRLVSGVSLADAFMCLLLPWIKRLYN